MKWEGVPFEVEWKGKNVTVFISYEALEDLGEFTATSDDEILRSFDKNKVRILGAVARLITDESNFDKRGRLYVRTKDFE